MPAGEFELIARYFGGAGANPPGVVVGIGDDAAVLAPTPNHQLVIAIDTLVAGVHFPPETASAEVGYKALAVNLSDLAAMGATPVWFTLALTMPGPDEAWLAGFSAGLFELAQNHAIPLVGGDTTRGPLTITIQAAGQVPPGAALLRRGARPGDAIYVTGTLGDAGVGLQIAQGRLSAAPGDASYLLGRLNRPTPRLDAGVALRGVASAAIDISDGLAADLGHILEQSGVGATIELMRLPLSPALQRTLEDTAKRCAATLHAGDDYELCFCVPPEREALLGRLARHVAVTRIGTIEAAAGLRIADGAGRIQTLELRGYDHFRSDAGPAT